ncbi:hypothetical protein BJ508DRAFT_312589 [Ascobolus immersus RN42]|uniref:F-box domain-containing protein n=1 Tax=Ascobolus immersus RN42 TaxID=1160509 RepID=A0A3N4HLN5_ASCIM|nr:hypothetical protein BJ508DRAFT_312589 [Ascobolus immersus RN42]
MPPTTFKTLPSTLHLEILRHIPSYDALINTISALPKLLKPLLQSYPKTIFRSLLAKELVGAGTESAGCSILVHALQNLYIERLLSRPCFSAGGACAGACQCRVEGDDSQECQWRQEASLLFNETKRLREGPAEEELLFWLRKVSGTGAQDERPTLCSGTVDALIELHSTTLDIFDGYVRAMEPADAADRDTFNMQMMIQSPPRSTGQALEYFKAQTPALRIRSEFQTRRRLRGVYGLRYIVQLLRAGHAAGLQLKEMQDVVSVAYIGVDYIPWPGSTSKDDPQLREIAEIYGWMKRQSRRPGQVCTGVEYHWNLASWKNLTGSDKECPREWEALGWSRHADNIVFAWGLGAIWPGGGEEVACDGLCRVKEGERLRLTVVREVIESFIDKMVLYRGMRYVASAMEWEYVESNMNIDTRGPRSPCIPRPAGNTISFSHLPPEIHLTILLHLSSYDTLINTISVLSTLLKPLLQSYPQTIFRSLLDSELAESRPRGITAGSSILVHALQQLYIERIVALPCFSIPARVCTRACKADLAAESAESQVCQWRQDVVLLFREAKRLRGGPAEEELLFWLRKLCETTIRAGDRLVLEPATVDKLLKQHSSALELFNTFTAESLPAIAKQRVASMQKWQDRRPYKTFTRPLDKAVYRTIQHASSRGVSATEKARILHGIYALHYFINVIRAGHAAGVAVREMQDVVWGSHDTIWHLEAVVTVYDFLKGRSSVMTAPLTARLRCVDVHEDGLSTCPSEEAQAKMAVRSWHVDNQVFAHGLEVIWQAPPGKEGCAKADQLMDRKSCEGVCGHLCENLEMQPGVLREVLLPYNLKYDRILYAHMRWDKLYGRICDFRYDRTTSGAWHGLRRMETGPGGHEGAKERVEKYVPMLRIADKRWIVVGVVWHAWWAGPEFYIPYYRGRLGEREVGGMLADLAVWDDVRLKEWGLVKPNRMCGAYFIDSNTTK